ncbi:uncharacterized protein L199_001647 [Kwoniella botswanensis]|uniref:uncharacterized protein n=1 Tax=Kwoniella botswanensis TaxID=1268659 RepID=UPI00315DEDF0
MLTINRALVLLALAQSALAVVIARDDGVQLQPPGGANYKDINDGSKIGDDMAIKIAIAAVVHNPPFHWVEDHILDLDNGINEVGVKTTKASFLLHPSEDERKTYQYGVDDMKEKFDEGGLQTNWWWQGLDAALNELLDENNEDKNDIEKSMRYLTGQPTEKLDNLPSDDDYVQSVKKDNAVLLNGSRKKVVLEVKGEDTDDAKITSVEMSGAKLVQAEETAKDLRKMGFDTIIYLKPLEP